MRRSEIAEPAGTAAPARFREGAWLAALVVAVFLVYSPVWDAGFIWDDDAHVTTNPVIVGPLGLKEIWTSAKANYFPLTMTSFWVQHALWGLNPLPYHLVGVALQAGCAVLLYLVLLRLGVRGALLGSALWALHPVQVESVAWISELKNTQSCFFFLLAVLFFLRWREADGRPAAWREYAAALGCALLAILSKTSTVMLPVVLGLVWWWRGDWNWRRALALGPFFAVSLAASAWTIWEQKVNSMASGPDWQQTLPERFVLAGRVGWFYLGKLAWPDPLIFIYPRWELDATRVVAWLPLAALGLAAGLLLRHRDGALRPWFFAGSYFFISLFPVLGFFDVFFFRFSFVADHFQHLASIGPMALAGAGIAGLAAWRPALPRRAIIAGGLAPVIMLALLTWRQCGIYRNSYTLWSDTVALNPKAWIARINLGVELVAAGRIAEAVEHYQAALALRPNSPEVHTNLGAALLQAGQPAEAVPVLEAAVQGNPRMAEAHNSLGLARVRVGRVEAAESAYREALRLKPDFAAARFNLAILLAAHQRVPEAIASLEETLRQTNDPLVRLEVQRRLAGLLAEAGRPAEALPHYEALRRVAPDDRAAHMGLAGVLFQLGRVPEAAAHYEELVRRDPVSAVDYGNLGSALVQLGRNEEAVVHFRTALQLQPESADTRANLAIALARLGRPEEAARECELALRASPDHALTKRLLAELRSRPAPP